jgi:hypothetical protein
MLEIHPWLISKGINPGWLFYEELQPAQYEALRQDSDMLRRPVALQHPDRPAFPLCLGDF